MVKCHACFCLFVFQVCLGLSLVSNILAVLNDANFCWRTLLGFCQTCTGVVSLKEWYAILWNKCQRSHQCWTSVSDYSEKCPRSGNRGWVIQRLPRPNKTLWRQQTKIKWLWLLNRLNHSFTCTVVLEDLVLTCRWNFSLMKETYFLSVTKWCLHWLVIKKGTTDSRKIKSDCLASWQCRVFSSSPFTLISVESKI